MIKTIKNNFKDLDILTKKIMRNGLNFCYVMGIFSLIILVTYIFSFTIPLLFNIGFILFKLSLIFGVEFIICGFAVDRIKNQII